MVAYNICTQFYHWICSDNYWHVTGLSLACHRHVTGWYAADLSDVIHISINMQWVLYLDGDSAESEWPHSQRLSSQ